MTAQQVVGIIQGDGEDWIDAYGHYWAWDATAGHWVHDRDRCDVGTAPCVGRAR